MKICSRCGYQNADDLKKCKNCYVDLRWAKVNLEKFTGTIEDTNRIGETERERIGIDSGGNDSIRKVNGKTQESWEEHIAILIPLLFSFAIGHFLAMITGLSPLGCGFVIFFWCVPYLVVLVLAIMYISKFVPLFGWKETLGCGVIPLGILGVIVGSFLSVPAFC